MVRMLGRRYDVLMKCIAADEPFTAKDVGEHQMILKGLLSDGYLAVVVKGSKTTPYKYKVSVRVRQYYFK